MERLRGTDSRTGVPCSGAAGDGVLQLLFQRCAALPVITEGDPAQEPLHDGETARHRADADTRKSGETHQGVGRAAYGTGCEDPLLRLVL